MSKSELRNRALEMRKKGMSYSQIREELGVSKSTLSKWLSDYPLSRERINELRGSSERRIEKYRETRAKNREIKQAAIYKKLSEEIGLISKRELFLAGLFLYWAEGTKASPGSIIMTNTDPDMLRFFIDWLSSQGVDKSKIRGYLHLYSDMNIDLQTKYWSESLGIPETSFRKPYIKESVENKRKNYKGRFGHGTCNLILNDVKLYDSIMNGIEYIKGSYRAVGHQEGLAV
jgi:predicted transcriptional regulator